MRTCAPCEKNGFLARDARAKERKKFGLKRARKAPQYTKREFLEAGNSKLEARCLT